MTFMVTATDGAVSITRGDLYLKKDDKNDEKKKCAIVELGQNSDR